jgi:hypothetical protein
MKNNIFLDKLEGSEIMVLFGIIKILFELYI